MKRYLFCIVLILVNLSFINASVANTAEKIEATTAAGDKVILLPNGRWEFVEAQKAAAAAEVAKQYPENQVCPPGAQGGHFGSRCVLVGDKDFNRSSLSGKGR